MSLKDIVDVGQYTNFSYAPLPLRRAKDFVGTLIKPWTYKEIDEAKSRMQEALEQEENPFKQCELILEVREFETLRYPQDSFRSYDIHYR